MFITTIIPSSLRHGAGRVVAARLQASDHRSVVKLRLGGEELSPAPSRSPGWGGRSSPPQVKDHVALPQHCVLLHQLPVTRVRDGELMDQELHTRAPGAGTGSPPLNEDPSGPRRASGRSAAKQPASIFSVCGQHDTPTTEEDGLWVHTAHNILNPPSHSTEVRRVWRENDEEEGGPEEDGHARTQSEAP
ncbi:unnamed protein product [Arctogadus glacialis]